jgi:pimeloyl-ACP methyl ester carboxylesterase
LNFVTLVVVSFSCGHPVNRLWFSPKWHPEPLDQFFGLDLQDCLEFQNDDFASRTLGDCNKIDQERKVLVESTDPPIYLIPGMTADFPVYSRVLRLLPNAIVADYIPPEGNETLVSYASRMANRIPANSFVAGVSFGGIVALEIARVVRPQGCILISSIRKPAELPPWFRIWRALGGRRSNAFLQTIGTAASMVPRFACTSSTIRVTKLAGAGGRWHRWATASVLDWQPDPEFKACPLLQIHGSADSTFPIRYINPDVTVVGGRHALTISHPKETAAAIRAFMGQI